ncbi:NAD(P)H-dependent oxidoreductase [Neisseria sp.]|uniref:NAD(P)H-dependent oxidoreductase n=1 Tax=Neisseria sp. TaxID=192066 RepID=UPI0026DD90BE|nr:NAD(P)H-dependent oxidoreductase [Neisseria sp.]MDO4907692.1 NAD(P)H-dependent oxidoreductase [Neisseria sp.]
MKNTVIVSGHPDLSESTANRLILKEVKNAMPNVQIRDLGKLYPDFNINVADEQNALANADIIVWQFPFYWYAMPALMKKWIDDVHTYGFAYGSTGNKLHGKPLIVSLTAGGDETGYSKGGHEGREIGDFFHQFEATAHLCGMDFKPVIYSYEMHYIDGVGSADDLARVQNSAKAHAEKLVKALSSL